MLSSSPSYGAAARASTRVELSRSCRQSLSLTVVLGASCALSSATPTIHRTILRSSRDQTGTLQPSPSHGWSAVTCVCAPFPNAHVHVPSTSSFARKRHQRTLGPSSFHDAGTFTASQLGEATPRRMGSHARARHHGLFPVVNHTITLSIPHPSRVLRERLRSNCVAGVRG